MTNTMKMHLRPLSQSLALGLSPGAALASVIKA